MLVAVVVILRLIVQRDYLRRGRLTPLSSAAEWLLGIIWASFSYVYLPEDWPIIQVDPTLQFAGWSLAGIGVATMLFSLGWLGLRRAHGLEVDLLLQTGPYRWTRNPQITGFIFGMIGFVMLWPSWHMLVSLLLLAVLAHVMVLTEEEHLAAVFGDEYRRYCERVPRYIGIPKQDQEASI